MKGEISFSPIIFEADVSDPVLAVEHAGGDTTVFFEHFDWSHMDFRQSDVSHVSFAGAILDGAHFYEDQLKVVLASNPKSTKNLQVSRRPQRSTKSQLDQEGKVHRRLDPLDRLLLELVQQDGRVPVANLASELSISTEKVLKRLQRLESLGYILGYYADVDRAQLGFEVTVFLLVGLVDQSEISLGRFEEECQKISSIRQCHMLNGEVDFILNVFSWT